MDVIASNGCFLFFHESHQELIKKLAEHARHSQTCLSLSTNTDNYICEKKGISVDHPLFIEENHSNRSGRVESFLDVLGADGEFPRSPVRTTDNPLESLREDAGTDLVVWGLGQEYLTKTFKESDVADVVVFMNNGPFRSSHILTNKGDQNHGDSTSRSEPSNLNLLPQGEMHLFA